MTKKGRWDIDKTEIKKLWRSEFVAMATYSFSDIKSRKKILVANIALDSQITNQFDFVQVELKITDWKILRLTTS